VESANSAQRSTHLLGVHSTLDGSSEESVKAWKDLLNSIADIYNQSPLGQCTSHLLQTMDIFIKLTGMHSDHCAKEKKDAQLLEKEKTRATYQSLGEKEILEKSNEELLPHIIEARKEMIKTIGGDGKWKSLSAIEQADQMARMMEKLVIKL